MFVFIFPSQQVTFCPLKGPKILFLCWYAQEEASPRPPRLDREGPDYRDPALCGWPFVALLKHKDLSVISLKK